MIERCLSFDSSAYSLDAIQRAAYRFSDRFSCVTSTTDADTIEVKVSFGSDDIDIDATLADFQSVVLDHVLRERIREETADVRNLVLALAFSKTSLNEAADG
jgi:His-Xaa-Ser system protein HxsD